MEIAERMNEFARLASKDFLRMGGEKRIARDIEGDAEEHVSAALIELKRDLPCLILT